MADLEARTVEAKQEDERQRREKTTLELVRRQLNEDDQSALVRAADLSADQLDTLIQQMNGVTPWGSIGTGTTINAGDLVSYEESGNLGLYRCVQQHDKQETWKPPSVPALFTDESPTGVIPAWQQPQGSHDAYHAGDLVTHNGSTWESDVDGNVWEPPTQWTETTA